ncbi:hypothetical protein [Sphingomonas sp. Marseille-Q8236]
MIVVQNFMLALIGIGLLLAIGFVLERRFGVPPDSSYRVACAGVCLVFIAKLDRDSGGERWLRIGLALSALINIALFATPIFDRPASRGEILFFAFPDLVIVMIARIVTYPVTDGHQRAVRQQLVVGLLLAIAFCALVMASALVPRT